MAVAISFSHFYLEVVGNSEKELKQSLPGISICLNVLHETLFDLRKWEYNTWEFLVTKISSRDFIRLSENESFL